MAVPRIRWIQANESVIGENHPTQPDNDNRPVKDIINVSNLNPQAEDFPGFLGVYQGNGDPNGVQVGNVRNGFWAVDTGILWMKKTGDGTNTGWVKVTLAGAAGGGGYPSASIDSPPALPDAMDDEFNDATGMSGPLNGLNAKWTWVNQGTATVAFGYDSLQLKALKQPAVAGNDLKMIGQPIPAGAWEFIGKVMMIQSAHNDVLFNHSSSGLYIRTAAGVIMTIEAANSAGEAIRFCRYNDANTFTSTLRTVARTHNTQWVYLKLGYNPADPSPAVQGWYSFSGLPGTFQSIEDEILTPQTIGIFSNVNSLTINNTTWCEFFRRVL